MLQRHSFMSVAGLFAGCECVSAQPPQGVALICPSES